MIKRRLGLIILSIYLSSQVLSALGYINRNQTFATETTKNKLNSLVAILVDDKIYNSIENELKRYAQEYIQKKYESSKALVIKLNTQEYDALEIVKLLENLYFDGEKEHGSELIGTILIGELPFPVVQYEDYFFPSIYPYVDFIDQKYLWNPENGYFTKDKENGQSEIWHGVINFQNDIEKYKYFFGKLKTYNNNPEQFADKKIWYDDFIALQNNILEENEKLYKNKLAFAEDLIYRRYTDLFFNTLQGENTKRMESLVQGLSENLKQLGSSTPEIPTQSNIPTSKTPTKLLEQKLQGVLKEYTNLISIPIQNTLNQNIAASDRWRNSADNHYQKLQLKDELILGNKTTNGILRSMNDKLEKIVDTKIKEEKYGMMSVIPTFYKQEQDERKRVLRKKYYFPKIKDHFKFYYFGKDSSTIDKAEEASIYRGSYRNLLSLGNYSTIVNDPVNPAKSQHDNTELKNKSFGASYDPFSAQISANRGFNTLATQGEYELYEKEKTHAQIEYECTKRRCGLKRKWVPCLDVRRKGVGKCNPNAKKLEFNKNSRKLEEHPNYDEMTDCENFEQFGNRIRGGATPLNMNMEKVQNSIYEFKGKFDPKSAWKSIFDIAGSVNIQNPEPHAQSFKGLKYYISPTKILHRDGALKDPIDHSLPYEKVEYHKVALNNKIFKKEGVNNFSLIKPKHHRTDLEEVYSYKLINSTIKHNATTSNQINGYRGLKYDKANEIGGYYSQISGNLSIPNNFPDPRLIKTFTNFQTELNTLKQAIENATTSGDYSIILGADTDQTKILNDFLKDQKLMGKYVDNVDYDVASPIYNTINSIIHQQIERNPKIGLYTPRFNQILEQFNDLEEYLKKQENTAINIHNTYLKLYTTTIDSIEKLQSKINSLNQQIDNLKKQITIALSSRPIVNRNQEIKRLETEIKTLKEQIRKNSAGVNTDQLNTLKIKLKQMELHLQLTQLERIIEEAEQAKNRINLMKDNILLSFNELQECNAHHVTLGEYLNINDEKKLIGVNEIKKTCQEINQNDT